MGASRTALWVWASGWAVAGLVAAAPAQAAGRFDVRGVEDHGLHQAIQDAIGPVAGAPASRLEARRKAAEAGERAIAVLRSEGYYDSDVQPDIGEGDTPTPFLMVTPGPRSTLAAAQIEWIGAPPLPQAKAQALHAVALKLGAPGRAEDVLAAEGRVVAALLKAGYADAEAKPREVVVDHADHSVQPTFRIAAGSLVRLGAVRLNGASRTRLALIQRLTPWKPGDVYQPQSIALLEKRLVDTGAYNAVSVSLAPASEVADGKRPVVISLTDRPKGTLELGASYSTTEGAGVDSRWIVYNRLGRADTLTSSILIAQLDSRIQTELDLPHWRRPEQTLKLTAALYRDDTTAYESSGATISADLTHKFGKISFLTWGVSVDGSQTTEKEAANFVTQSRRRNLATLAGLVAFAVDRSNDPLDPTAGWRLSARAEPTYAVGDGPVAYLKSSAQVSGYLPLGHGGTVIAGRAKLGAIFGGDIPLVPDPARFFAGGGGSVRGYAYQAVGPRYPDNTPEGGLSLFESSLEVRQHVTQKWSVVGFIDAGAVGKQVNPDFTHPDIGVGVGARYDLGFGPIRVDIGTPLVQRHGDAGVQLYLSIGQSF